MFRCPGKDIAYVANLKTWKRQLPRKQRLLEHSVVGIVLLILWTGNQLTCSGCENIEICPYQLVNSYIFALPSASHPSANT